MQRFQNCDMHRRSSINDFTQFWTVLDPPLPIVTLFITTALVLQSQNFLPATQKWVATNLLRNTGLDNLNRNLYKLQYFQASKLSTFNFFIQLCYTSIAMYWAPDKELVVFKIAWYSCQKNVVISLEMSKTSPISNIKQSLTSGNVY